MFLNAFLAALTLYLAELGSSWFGNQMLKRPIVVGTLAGILLGDVTTGAIVGGQLELLYLGIVNVGGVEATDACFSTAFAAAICILFNYTWEQALVIAVPIGYLGLFFANIKMFINSLLVPVLDKLIAEDKMKQFSFAYLASPAILLLIPATALFLGIYVGADLLEMVIANLPPFLSTGMAAAGKMLPAVGMGILLNYIWDSKLSIYLILGFAVSAFLDVTNIFIAILALFLAYLDMNRFMDRKKSADMIPNASNETNNNDEVEGFFNE
jgi:mannose/fructose/N-acetylgalactosamine-specific phosphotransferase system component IIC